MFCIHPLNNSLPLLSVIPVLRLAPFYLGHIGELRDGHFTGVRETENDVAHFALGALHDGVEDYLCHASFLRLWRLSSRLVLVFCTHSILVL